MYGQFRSFLLIIAFFTMIYLILNSISSLGFVDLVQGKYKEIVLDSQIRYKRALKQSQNMSVNIRKCCIESEMFDNDLRCINTTEGLILDVFLKQMIVDENLNLVNIYLEEEINIIHDAVNCRDEVIILSNDTIPKHFIVSTTNELLELANRTIVANYSRHYCIETLDNQRLAIVVCHKYLNKCCRGSRLLNDKFECEPKKIHEKTWPLPLELVENGYNRLKYTNYNKLEDDDDEFLPINLELGDIIKQIKGKQDYELGIKDILQLYPEELYCFDQLKRTARSSSSFAAKFSLCKNHICLQKCCPQDELYDVQTETCSILSESEQGKSVDIAIINKRKIENLEEYFIIYNKQPTCRYHKAIHPYEGADRIFLQANGNIIRKHSKKETEILKPTRYCVDLFRENGVALANGFFCSSSSKTVLSDEVPYEDNSDKFTDCPDKNPNNKNSSNKLLIIVLIVIYYYCQLI